MSDKLQFVDQVCNQRQADKLKFIGHFFGHFSFTLTDNLFFTSKSRRNFQQNSHSFVIVVVTPFKSHLNTHK
jgi:hypothetical protein